MTDRRLSREAVEALVSITPDRRLSRASVEVLTGITPDRRVAQEYVEVLFTDVPWIQVAGTMRRHIAAINMADTDLQIAATMQRHTAVMHMGFANPVTIAATQQRHTATFNLGLPPVYAAIAATMQRHTAVINVADTDLSGGGVMQRHTAVVHAVVQEPDAFTLAAASTTPVLWSRWGPAAAPSLVLANDPAVDSSGHGHHGHYVDRVQGYRRSPGLTGPSSYEFSSFLADPNALFPDDGWVTDLDGGPFSIMLWGEFNTSATYAENLLTLGGSISLHHPPGTVQWGFYRHGGSVNGEAGFFGSGTHAFLLTYDGDRITVYADGVPDVAYAHAPGGLYVGGGGGTTDLVFGAPGGTNTGTKQWLGDLLVWDRGLTADEAADLWEAGSRSYVAPAATMRRHTAAMFVVPRPLARLAGTMQRHTAAAHLYTVRDVRLAGTMQRHTAAIAVRVTREARIAATMQRQILSSTVAVEAYVQFAGTVQRPVAAFGLVFPPRGDTTNRVGGRTRSGLGIASWTPPVVPLPARFHIGDAIQWAAAFSAPTIVNGRPTYTVSAAYIRAPQDRIVIGSTDVTYFRGVPTPFPGYQLVEPLLYGPTTITFPQIAACFEQLGVGDLRWCRDGAPVRIQRVDPDTGTVLSTDYKGVVVGFDADGAQLTVQVGGEAQGRAALTNRQVPIWTNFQDIGRYAYSAMKGIGLRLEPYLGPTTGIRLQRFGGQSNLDYISELVARAWNRNGNQWTIMPKTPQLLDGVYRMTRKDTTTIAGTAYADDARLVASLHRDLAEEPDRIFMTGVTPAGERIRFGVYPGLRQTNPPPYPYVNHNHTFGPETVDSDTDTGDGITVMVNRLIVCKYLDQENHPDGYDNQTARAIRNLQADAGQLATGVMDWPTWKALYDLDVTGYSLRWSHIEPAAQRSKVRKWNRSGSGAIMGRNPHYDPSALVVDTNIDIGSGFTRDQMREWSQAELQTEDNWAGTLAFPTGALIKGTHTPGDPVTTAEVMPARDLKPGMNLSLPLFQGGITVHVAAVTVGTDRSVSADVDTRARDAMKVWEVIARNRESRNNPARAWLADHRSSTMTKDSMGIWDEVGGLLYQDVPVPSHKWTVFPVVAGQEGTVRSLRLNTNPDAEFVTAVFGDVIYGSRLAALVGNPLSKAGAKRWANASIRAALDARNILLYIAGDNDNPCGYYPKQKQAKGDQTGGTDDAPVLAPVAPLTGEWYDDAGFSYHTGQNPVLYVAVYADRDTKITAGRIMWNQLEAGV